MLPTDMSKKAKREMMEEMFLELYYNGKSDFSIALKLGVSEMTIGNLRRSLKLEANRGKKIKKEPVVTGK